MSGEQLELLQAPDADAIGKFQRPDAGAAETQRLAAIAAYPRTGTVRLRVLELVAGVPSGLTDEQILTLSPGANPSTLRPRRIELVELGWIEDSGERRPTASGREAAVWTLTAAGRMQIDRLPFE